jgi:hypothetical protein
VTQTQPHRIVFANEKGGTGKSTTAVHVAVALAYQGAKVAALDLDPRQRTFHRYCENRVETMRRRGIELPSPGFGVFEGDSVEALDAQAASLAEGADFIVFDTPGRDDPFARHVATQADTLVTPMNDSFVDFDLIGQVTPSSSGRLASAAAAASSRSSAGRWTGSWCATAPAIPMPRTSVASSRRWASFPSAWDSASARAWPSG